MSIATASAQRKIFNEDIVLAGETIISTGCTIYSITLINDSATASVVNLSDSTTYSAASKVAKACVPANSTVSLTYPKGMPMAEGLSAAANSGSIDIAVTYD